jgi:hypothetical protein
MAAAGRVMRTGPLPQLSERTARIGTQPYKLNYTSIGKFQRAAKNAKNGKSCIYIIADGRLELKSFGNRPLGPAARRYCVTQLYTARGSRTVGRTPPVIVLSPAAYNEKTSLMICCPVTTQVKHYPFEVLISRDRPSVGPDRSIKKRGLARSESKTERRGRRGRTGRRPREVSGPHRIVSNSRGEPFFRLIGMAKLRYS